MRDVVLQRIRNGWAEQEKGSATAEPQIATSAPTAESAPPVPLVEPNSGAHDDRGRDGLGRDAGVSDAGMSTVEYAVGTVVAAAFAAVLYRIVTGDSVIAGLTNLINTALNTSF